MDDYESWTRAEIETARARVHDLERALEMFLAWRSSNPATAKASPRISPMGNRGGTPLGALATNKRKRSSKNEAIFNAFEAAGSAGLSQEDIQAIAQAAGLNTNSNALRVLCWAAKKDGRLISLAPGRYAIAPKNEAAVENLSEGETAAPAREPHDQHREGDAGGGI